MNYEAHFFSEHWNFNVNSKNEKKEKNAVKSLWFFR